MYVCVYIACECRYCVIPITYLKEFCYGLTTRRWWWLTRPWLMWEVSGSWDVALLSQDYALSGMDLTFGRWDTWEHRLTDIGVTPLGLYDNPLVPTSKRGSMVSLAGGVSHSRSLLALVKSSLLVLWDFHQFQIPIGANSELWFPLSKTKFKFKKAILKC